jgi:7-cyano-7-deazaguanine synthase
LTTTKLPDAGLPTVVLASGGLDSTAVVALMLSRGPVSMLFVDYGQPSRHREWGAVQIVASHYGLEVERLILPIDLSRTLAMPGRNGWLLHSALLRSWPFVGNIAAGIHGGSQYPDCSPAFLEQMQNVFDLYCGGVVRVVAPFISWMKGDVVRFAVEAKVPIDVTYSCDLGRDQPCGACLSCRDVESRIAGAKK